jgi:mediator of RNA polymerase II transcription subunit 14
MSQEEGLTIDTVDLPEHSGILNTARPNGVHEDSFDDLERELPVVFDGQASLGDLLSRVVQSIYAELSELAET